MNGISLEKRVVGIRIRQSDSCVWREPTLLRPDSFAARDRTSLIRRQSARGKAARSASRKRAYTLLLEGAPAQ